jgi:hypothetical protein
VVAARDAVSAAPCSCAAHGWGAGWRSAACGGGMLSHSATVSFGQMSSMKMTPLRPSRGSYRCVTWPRLDRAQAYVSATVRALTAFSFGGSGGASRGSSRRLVPPPRLTSRVVGAGAAPLTGSDHVAAGSASCCSRYNSKIVRPLSPRMYGNITWSSVTISVRMIASCASNQSLTIRHATRSA